MSRKLSAKPLITIVGAGNLAGALAVSLHGAGYRIDQIVSRTGAASLQRARRLAREVGASVVAAARAQIRAEVVWFCVPDGAIARAAKSLAGAADWNGKVALHSSGALTSDELAVLRRLGAAVASVHPLMTFVRGSRPSFAGVPFAVEGSLEGGADRTRDCSGSTRAGVHYPQIAERGLSRVGNVRLAAADCFARGQRARRCCRRSRAKCGVTENAADPAANSGELRTAGRAGLVQWSHRSRRCGDGCEASQGVARSSGSEGNLRCSGDVRHCVICRRRIGRLWRRFLKLEQSQFELGKDECWSRAE